uniref:hypothetical protein n=1 Tax=Halomonas sp. TaxID=1486246 RepID=UPI002617F8FB|nr:hypothetical protein [Halomonas sp.]
MIQWPAELPQEPLADGYREVPGNNVLESGMDAGPKKTRRRFTAVEKPLPLSFLLEADQADIFEDFFENTLLDGSLPFSMLHPRKKTPVTMLFVGKEKYALEPLGSGTYYQQLTMNLEIQP